VPPALLEPIYTSDKHDRLRHTYGAGTVDIARALRREFRNPPDVIAYPRTEQDIFDLFDWCASRQADSCPEDGDDVVTDLAANGCAQIEEHRELGA
jgi:alkyldihydroxyacetonephosphate synthase